MNQGWSGRSTISGSSPSGLMPREDQAALLERVLVMDVDLVAVAVALADRVGAVDRANDAVAVELAPHRRRAAWCRRDRRRPRASAGPPRSSIR